MTCQGGLGPILKPENVLKHAEEKLIPQGGQPFGKEKELEILIQDLSSVVIKQSAGKTPEDFYSRNIRVQTPQRQIKTNATNFARKILRSKSERINEFCESSKDSDTLSDISDIVVSTIASLAAEYFLQLYDGGK